MITFGYKEILFSLFVSMLYGLIFASLVCIIDVFSELFKRFLNIPKDIFFYEKLKSKVMENPIGKSAKKRQIMIFFYTILFFAGFMIASYFSLDGQIRLYMLFLSSASLYVSNITIIGLLRRLFSSTSHLLYSFFAYSLRYAVYPFKRIVTQIRKKCK